MTISASKAQEVLSEADCCFTNEQVEQAIDRMAQEITLLYQNLNPLLLCVMNGGLITTAQLLLRLNFPLQYDYIHATRYDGKTRGGELNWIARSSYSLEDRHVLVIDDILDEGLTLAAISEYCQNQNAKTVRSAVLVEKVHNRKQGPDADFIGLRVEDRYVFGYGMDFKGFLRNVPGIYAACAKHVK